jgi:mannose-6-phosphate isomerase-like protein (cupin superfamily)
MGRPVKIIAAGAGTTIQLLGGDVVTTKIVGADTDGSMAIIEYRSAPHGGPPRHVHFREDKVMVVLTGKYRFWIGEKELDADPGTVIFVPRGTPHQFSNLTAEPARLLSIHQPAGIERMIEELQAVPPDRPLELAEVGAMFSRYGLALV